MRRSWIQSEEPLKSTAKEPWEAFQDQSELLTRAIDDSLIKTDLLKQEKPFKQYESIRRATKEQRTELLKTRRTLKSKVYWKTV